jgi:hypothetical protein
MNPTRYDLIDLEVSARGGKPKTLTFGENTFSVEIHIVNRKCYDNQLTPTAMFKVNGKRVSRQKFYGYAN